MRVQVLSRKSRREKRAYIRGLAVGMSMDKRSVTEIAKTLKVSRRTIQRWKTRHEMNIIHDRRVNGPALKTTSRSNRMLFRLAKKYRFSSARELLNMWREKTCLQTLYNRLRAAGLRKRKPFRCPLLSKVNKKARLSWAMRKCLWRSVWKSIIFSDESRFRRMSNDRRIQVWRSKGDRMVAQNCRCITQGLGGSIHVWGAIWLGGRSKLYILKGYVTGKSYIDTLKSFFDDETTPDYIFQDDNAPAHRSSVVETFHTNNLTRRIDWPSKSPDLNPIEHLWDLLKRKVAKHGSIESLSRLKDIVLTEWEAIPQSVIDNLILSMSRRVRAVIIANGGATRY